MIWHAHVNRLPYLLPWVKVNLLIHSITGRIWPEDQWSIIKPQLRCALEIRSQLGREGWRN
jgi:hypothetical protein